jgi:hypothetical protein
MQTRACPIESLTSYASCLGLFRLRSSGLRHDKSKQDPAALGRTISCSVPPRRPLVLRSVCPSVGRRPISHVFSLRMTSLRKLNARRLAGYMG